jgi:hypothetical protein
MADFKQALDWLNEGKRVRCSHWDKQEYLCKYFDSLNDENSSRCVKFDTDNIFATDWELYEENPKHFCKAVNHPNANIRCVSLIDSNKWLCLFWIDESFLLVEYCPFCGKKAGE